MGARALTCDTSNAAETVALASQFAQSLKPGSCVAISGELGAGKTQFVRGIVQGLGGDERAVSSPTYVLLHVYKAPRMQVFHLDAYRVSGPADFDGIGFPELLDQQGVVVVEWPERVEQVLPAGTIRVSIEHTGESSRRVTISRSK